MSFKEKKKVQFQNCHVLIRSITFTGVLLKQSFSLFCDSRYCIMDALSEANGTFALRLLKILCQDSRRNVFYSPVSISSALAMVLLGAKGNTAAQMAQVNLPERRDCFFNCSVLLPSFIPHEDVNLLSWDFLGKVSPISNLDRTIKTLF